MEERHLLAQETPNKDIIYARVSAHGQAKQGGLDRQVSLDFELASKYGLNHPEVIKDIASGLNTRRKGLIKIVSLARQGQIGRIFVSRKDRLTRFGFDYLKWLFEVCGAEIIVLEEDEAKQPQQELVDDLMALLASFSGKLYGLRRKEKAEMRRQIDSVKNLPD